MNSATDTTELLGGFEQVFCTNITAHNIIN